MSKELEEGKMIQLDFCKLKKIAEKCPDVLPVVVQDYITKEVLILAYANPQALASTLSKGVAVFWSTSRNELWVKGETSGSILKIVEVRVNCEQNSLLYLVEKPDDVGACHTKDEAGKFRNSCYYRKVIGLNGEGLSFVSPE